MENTLKITLIILMFAYCYWAIHRAFYYYNIGTHHTNLKQTPIEFTSIFQKFTE
jgi:hypothetical protein